MADLSNMFNRSTPEFENIDDWDTKQVTDLTKIGENMEPDIECEDEYYYDPTLLTFQIDGNVMFNGGLEYLCKQQEFTGKPMHMALKDYDVVIRVTKPQPKPPEIVCVYRMDKST